MPFIYITGAAGSGKSALANLLRAQGLDVYDEDDPAVGSAHNLQTGKPVVVPDVSKRGADWFSRHEWRVLDVVKNQLKSKATSRTVILLGSSIKPNEQAELFDKVMYLKTDDKTLRERILARADNDYGKSASEMQQILDRKKAMDDLYNKSAAVTIDATKPLKEVADTIKQLIRA